MLCNVSCMLYSINFHIHYHNHSHIHTDTAEVVARLFYRDVFRLHGLPDSIVSDRDSRITAKFWKQLMDCCGTDLKMRTIKHLQTDGATELINRVVENYPRCYCSHTLADWDELLLAAEFAYNFSTVESVGISPFELGLGWCPRSALELFARPADNSIQSASEIREKLQNTFEDARFAFRFAQVRQSAYNAQRCTPPPYEVGDQLYLRRRLFTYSASAVQWSRKLRVKHYGPYRIKKLIGPVAVQLKLPRNISIHPVVHVEYTKPARTQPRATASHIPAPTKPFTDEHGDLVIEIDSILAHRRRGRGYQFFRLYKSASPHEAEWMPLRNFIDADGTITMALHLYVTANNILPELHWLVGMNFT